MNEEKLLSIIIPSYNMEKFLRRCLDRLIIGSDQMEWIDVLIVNDGSTDSTSAIGHEYESKYPGIFRVIDKPNGHYGSCINAALKVALGKYIRILDADDYFDTKAFTSYLNALSRIDVDLVVTDFTQVDPDGHVVSRTVYQSLKTETVIRIEDTELPVLMMHAMTYRTALVRKVGYRQTEGILYTDMEWSFIPLLDAVTIYYVHQNVYQYLVGREGQSVSKELEQKMMPHRMQVLQNVLHAFLGNHRNTKLESLKEPMRNTAVNIYLMIIINGEGNEDNQKLLKDFDENLKGVFPRLYDYLGRFYIRIFCFRYKIINRWRAGKLMDVNRLHFFIKLDNLYLAFCYKCKMIWHKIWK